MDEFDVRIYTNRIEGIELVMASSFKQVCKAKLSVDYFDLNGKLGRNSAFHEE
jgi:hypothetical protein